MREILPPGTLGNAWRHFQRSHLGWGVGLLMSSGTKDPGRFCAFCNCITSQWLRWVRASWKPLGHSHISARPELPTWGSPELSANLSSLMGAPTLSCPSSSAATDVVWPHSSLVAFFFFYIFICASLVAQCKESTCSARDSGLIPRLGRSPGEGNGNPLQYS